MKRKRLYLYYLIGIFGCLFFLAAEAPAPLISPGEIDLYRQLGLRFEKKVDEQNTLKIHCVVEDPQLLKKHGMKEVNRGDRVLLSQERKNRWLVKNEASGSVVSIEVVIREFYDHYKPKL